MIDFNSAYRKLNDLKSEVSCHYLISREGKIYNLLCPKFKGWHAGISEWKNIKNLNEIQSFKSCSYLKKKLKKTCRILILTNF